MLVGLNSVDRKQRRFCSSSLETKRYRDCADQDTSDQADIPIDCCIKNIFDTIIPLYC